MSHFASDVRPWILAARPKTLFAAVTPVIVGTAAAYRDGTFAPGPALAALLGATFIQIGTNFANDVADFRRGVDTQARLGPLRVTQAGLLTSTQVTAGMWGCFALASLAGLYLALVAGWSVIAIGLLSIAAGLAYTAGPLPLGYHGLGDLAVFIFFGLVAVGGTYFVQAREVVPIALLAAVPIGCLATAILVINNLRDLPTDRAAGKRTLAVRLGPRRTQLQFLLLLAISYLSPFALWFIAGTTPWVLLTWLSLPQAVRATRQIYLHSGQQLNPTLAATSQLEFLFGLSLAVGLILS